MRDLSKSKEELTANSSSAKKNQRETAIINLEKAKKLNRKVVFVKQGEGEFSKRLKAMGELAEMLTTKAAAEYLNISYYAFSRRNKTVKIPSFSKGLTKFFKVSDLDKYKDQITHV